MKQPLHPHCPDCGAPVDLKPGHRRLRCGHCGSQLIFNMGLRGRAALMSLNCPTCGAATEYPEDAHTVVCSYCETKHIVTGAGRTLRFYVPPRLTRDEALAVLGRKGGTKALVPGKAFLAFVPYWRYRGMAYTWETGVTRSVSRDSIFGSFSNMRVRRLNARNQDWSIQAGWFGFGWPGLGMRLTAVSQAAYEPEEMARLGRVLEPTLPRKEALRVMEGGAAAIECDPDMAHHMQHGSVVGGKLSMVWHPYWIIPCQGGSSRCVVDASGGGVLPEARKAPREPPVAISAEAPSLIPAQCPRCGNDFPAEGFEKLYFCGPCQLGWRPEGRKLLRQDFQLIAQPNKSKVDAHFPMWCLQVSIKSGAKAIKDQAAFRTLVPGWSYSRVNQDPKKPIFLYIPAWGNRIVPKFSIHAKRFTREQPQFYADKRRFGPVIRAIFGPREASELALLHLLGVMHVRRDLAKLILDSHLKVDARALYLIPFRRGIHEWHDNITNTAIPLGQVTERRY